MQALPVVTGSLIIHGYRQKILLNERKQKQNKNKLYVFVCVYPAYRNAKLCCGKSINSLNEIRELVFSTACIFNSSRHNTVTISLKMKLKKLAYQFYGASQMNFPSVVKKGNLVLDWWGFISFRLKERPITIICICSFQWNDSAKSQSSGVFMRKFRAETSLCRSVFLDCRIRNKGFLFQFVKSDFLLSESVDCLPSAAEQRNVVRLLRQVSHIHKVIPCITVKIF